MKLREQHVAVVLAALIALCVILSLSGLDVQWLGVEVDGGLLRAR